MQNEVGPSHSASFDPRNGWSVVSTVTRAVAAVRGVEPTRLPPLYDVVDPDALVALFTTRDRPATPLTVTFEYAGCRVAVDRIGLVRVRDDVPGPQRGLREG